MGGKGHNIKISYMKLQPGCLCCKSPGKFGTLSRMHELITIMAYLLMMIAIAPLALLAIYLIADHLELPLAAQVLDLLHDALLLQGFGGALINMLCGIGLMALGYWGVMRAGLAWSVLPPAMLALFGAWRGLRGLALLRALLNQ